MSIDEGLHRIAVVIRVATNLFSFLIVGGGIAVAIFGDPGGGRWSAVGIGFGIGIVLYAIGHALAWVIDGFAGRKEEA